MTIRLVQEELVILDSDSQKVHRLNSTAGFVWNHCDGTATAEQIAADLAKSYAVDLEKVLPDVVEAIAALQTLGLLEPG